MAANIVSRLKYPEPKNHDTNRDFKIEMRTKYLLERSEKMLIINRYQPKTF